MAEFRLADANELRPVLETLNGLEWPVSYDDFPEIFKRLGWEKQRRRGGITSLGISLPLVSVGGLGDEIAEIQFRVSDTLLEADAESKRIVKERFPDAVAAVTECLDAAPSGTPWITAGARWELAGGRQLNLLQLDDVIVLQYWSKRMADIERHERAHGVDPEHNLDDRE